MEELEKKPTTVGGSPTGDYTESGNPTHNPDGTFGSEKGGGTSPSSSATTGTTSPATSVMGEAAKAKVRELLLKKMIRK